MVPSNFFLQCVLDSNSEVGSHIDLCSSSHFGSSFAAVEHSLLSTSLLVVDNIQQYDLQWYNRYIETEGLGSLTDNSLILYNYSIT